MSSDTLASVSSPSVVNAVVGGSFAGPVPGPGRRWPASSLPRPSQPRPGGQPGETMAVRPDLSACGGGNFMRRLVLPEDMKHWTLFQLAEVLVTREMLTGILAGC